MDFYLIPDTLKLIFSEILFILKSYHIDFSRNGVSLLNPFNGIHYLSHCVSFYPMLKISPQRSDGGDQSEFLAGNWELGIRH